jgi:hypothetical protein
MKVKLSSLAAVTICVLFLTSGAFANLVTNGSFETGNFNGWTQTCSAGCGGNNNGVANGPLWGYPGAENGSYWAWLADPSPGGTLSQTFADTAGTKYTFSFWLTAEGDVTSGFNAYWDGAQLLALTNPNTGKIWTEYSFTVTGTGSDTIQFAYFDNPWTLGLDNVVVTPVPETTTLATLLGFGIFNLAAVFGFRRKLI